MSEKEVEKKVPEKKSAEKKAAEKKPGFFQRIKRSSKASLNELKKVHWPTRQELLTYTGVVLVSVAAVSAMIWIVDSLITALFGLLV